MGIIEAARIPRPKKRDMLLIFLSTESNDAVVLRRITDPKRREECAPIRIIITEKSSGDPPLRKKTLTTRTSLIIK